MTDTPRPDREPAGLTGKCERFHLLAPVWNPRYVELFGSTALPSMLSAGNLGAMPRDRTLFHIFTKKSDVQMLESFSSYQRLKQMVDVRIDFIDDIDMHCHYLAMSRCYEIGLEHSADRETAFFFLTADSVWSDGAFRRCLEVADQGKRALMVAGMMVWDLFSAECVRRYYDDETGVLTVPPRGLVELLLDYPHPRMLSLFRETANPVMAHFLWRLSKRSFLARCFHLHPLMVWPVLKNAKALYPTMDLGYVQEVCPDFSTVHIVTDSDEMCVVGSTSRDQYALTYPDHVSIDETAQWVRATCNDHQQRYATYRIFFHSDGNIPTESPCVARSDSLIQSVLDRVHSITDAVPVCPSLPKRLYRYVRRRLAHFSSLKPMLKRWIRRPYVWLHKPIYARMECLQAELRRIEGRINAEPRLTRATGETAYLAMYSHILDHLQRHGITGDMVEFGVGDGVRARLLAEAIFRTRFTTRLVVADTFSRPQDLAEEGLEAKERLLDSLRLIIPESHVCVRDFDLGDPMATLKDVDKLSFVQIDSPSWNSVVEILQSLSAHDLLQDQTIVYLDQCYPLLDNRPVDQRPLFYESWQLTEFFRCGDHGHAFVLQGREATWSAPGVPFSRVPGKGVRS